MTTLKDERVIASNSSDVMASIKNAEKDAKKAEVEAEAAKPEGKKTKKAEVPQVWEVTVERPKGRAVAKIANYPGEAGVRLTWSEPNVMAELENIIKSSVNVKDEDGYVIATVDPNVNGREYVKQLPDAEIGYKYTACCVINYDA